MILTATVYLGALALGLAVGWYGMELVAGK